jgi:hypothetical protein
MGAYAGVYTQANMVTLLDAIGRVMDTHYSYDKVKRGPRHFVLNKGTYRVGNITEIIDYMISADGPELPMVMTKEYGADHGDYHFTGQVTKKKAQWTIAKEAALALMEAEIDRHLPALLAGTPDEGWQMWYISGDAGRNIGDTVAGSVSAFTIQLQVSKEFNKISYHGYPDQRVLASGVGKTKSSIE